ncbi:expressed unknown protein [Seminavis robusta]|uniref:Uncharacterized protein n=1 Tax=Seminavis robusta TaxID=568900 RepID=A0A9N8ERZ1_9STRA|nr:expressed unknown protein [Seminavis robusta]|eukprot:Sro1929_g306070.1 n/a (286) ;mRNA; r:6201-7058
MTTGKANYQWTNNTNDNGVESPPNAYASTGATTGLCFGEPSFQARTPVAAVSPDQPTRTRLSPRPPKGILKPPSWASLPQCRSSATAPRIPIRRTVTDTLPNGFAASPPDLEETVRPRRRCVSFSDSMCRWQNQGSSSHSLNAMHMPRRHNAINEDTFANSACAVATIPASVGITTCSGSTDQQSSVSPAPTTMEAAVSAQGNHVWSNGGTGRFRKRTQDQANLSSAPMRQPRRRRSNENEPLVDADTNVFQTSVRSFLMNARIPTRSSSSSTPRPADDHPMDQS